MNGKLYTLKEISDLLRIPIATLSRAKNRFPHYKINRRKLYKLEEVRSIIYNGKVWIEK